MSGLDDRVYRRLFKASPGKILVLCPIDYEIVAVTNDYLKATMTRESDILGKTLFEVFPDNPEDPLAEGEANLLASLERVRSLKKEDIVGMLRYPVRGPDGRFEERFWSPVNSPVLDDAGNIEFIMHRVEDITAIVKEGQDRYISKPDSPHDPLALQDIILRSRELRQTLSKLQEYEARMRTAERLLNLGAWEYDLTTRRLSWSEQVFRIYDVPTNQAAPDFDEYLAMVHPDDQASSLGLCEAFVEQNAPHLEFEHRVVASDGSERYVKGVGERHLSGDRDIVVGYVQDITPMMATRRRLTQAEKLLQLAGQKARLGGWRVELSSGAIIWTQGTAAVHGAPSGYSPASVSKVLKFYLPEYRKVIRAAFDRCVRLGEDFDVVCQIEALDGSRPWVRAIGVAERDEEGRINAVQGALQDISKLRAAQERAKEADRQKLDVLESISDACYALDHAWHFTYLNHKAGVLLERSREELLGKNFWKEFPGAVGSHMQDQYQWAVDHQNTARFQYYDPPLDKWFEISAYPVPEGLTVYFRDVTLERQHHEQLRQAHERFELMSKATNDVIWDWKLTDNTVWWNDSMTEMFGYRASELESGPESWIHRIHPDDRGRVLDSIYAVIDCDETRWREEYRFVRSDGRSANVIDRGFVIRDETGKAVRLVGSIIDITERMEMERRLRESQKLEAVGHLTGGVAHDFNNLLTVIMGNAEVLAEVLTDPKLRPMAEITVSAAQRGAELTSRLLAFARRKPLDPRPTDLNQLVEAMRALIRRTLPESIELDFVPGPDLGMTEIDASELDTALLNLVVNARDAMSEGGKLTIETTNTLLDQDYADHHSEVVPGEYVMVCVSDTGIGMDADTVLNAFEPFFTTKALGKGSGLGLSMVFGFTKQSGGHIKIYSEPGEGTSVKLYFPRVWTEQQPSDFPLAEAPRQGGSEHILIAEDDDLVLQYLQGQLESLGYRVTAVMSGPEALEALQAHRDIDLLLTDVIMPGGMNGRELAGLARADDPSLKVLFTSGYTENAIIHHGRLDPGVDLLSKPYTRLELATKVRRVLDKKPDSEA